MTNPSVALKKFLAKHRPTNFVFNRFPPVVGILKDLRTGSGAVRLDGVQRINVQMNAIAATNAGKLLDEFLPRLAYNNRDLDISVDQSLPEEKQETVMEISMNDGQKHSLEFKSDEDMERIMLRMADIMKSTSGSSVEISLNK